MIEHREDIHGLQMTVSCKILTGIKRLMDKLTKLLDLLTPDISIFSLLSAVHLL